MPNLLLQQVQLALRNKTQRDALLFVDEIVDFCQKEGKNRLVLDNWGRDLVQLLVAYHLAKETLIVIRGKDGKIDGVFMYYKCNSDDSDNFLGDWKSDDPNGDTYFLAFCYADNTIALKQTVIVLLKRHPDILTSKLTTIRERNGFPTVVKYRKELFKKILEL